jgi:drug/metabolite transporter (DMT)-like permease
MLTILLGLAAACLYSLYNLFSQRLLRRMSWMTITVAMFVTGLVLLGVPALLIDGLPLAGDQLRDLGLAALGGLLYTLATGSFLLALRVGKLSVVVVLACLDGAFAAAISIAMGEELSAMAAAGLVLAAGGGLLAAVERAGKEEDGGDGGRRWRFAAGAGLALLCGAAMAGVFIAYGQIEAFSPFTTVSVASVAGLVVIVPAAAAGGALLPPRELAAGVVGVSVVDMLAFLAGSAALALGPVSVASVLQAQTATVSTLLGLAVLRERPAWWQALGVAATIVGVSLLAWAM